MRNYAELSEFDQDILKELGNIGVGNAVTALSDMLGRTFRISLPRLLVLPCQQVPALIGGPELFETGVLLSIHEGLEGVFMFLMDEEFTGHILQILLGEEKRDIAYLNEMERSAMCEVGNIICSSYINAISTMLGERITVSTPDLCCDMAGAILSVPMTYFADLSDELLLIENRFQAGELEFTGYLLFLPTVESLNKLLNTFGV